MSLAHILSDEVVLAIHLLLGFVALLANDGQHPQMSPVQFLAPSEMATLVPLVLSHPDYCPTPGGSRRCNQESPYGLLPLSGVFQYPPGGLRIPCDSCDGMVMKACTDRFM